MSNLPKQARGREERERESPSQYGSGGQEGTPRHLVTAAHRGYSFRLLEVYATKFARRRFPKRSARPS